MSYSFNLHPGDNHLLLVKQYSLLTRLKKPKPHDKPAIRLGEGLEAVMQK